MVQVCRDGVKKAKAHLKLSLEGNKKYHKMGFYKYTDIKRKTRENMAPLLNSVGNLVTKYVEKAELPNAIFASVSTSKICLQKYQAPATVEKTKARKT